MHHLRVCLEFYSMALSRAGLNEREAPGKVVAARPPKRLAQLRSVSHALFSTCRSAGQTRQN